jgi:hypothetical protein
MSRGPARFFAIGLAVIFVSFFSGCVAIFSATLYDRLTLVAPDCGGGYVGATPASFRAWVDSAPYLMPDYQEVRFPSRDPAITIDAWWSPGQTADAPAVVLAHGLHECKRATTVLFPAGALHRHGYSVLVIDLRNEGSSTIDNGRDTGGTGEARDMLGAWDSGSCRMSGMWERCLPILWSTSVGSSLSSMARSSGPPTPAIRNVRCAGQTCHAG